MVDHMGVQTTKKKGHRSALGSKVLRRFDLVNGPMLVYSAVNSKPPKRQLCRQMNRLQYEGDEQAHSQVHHQKSQRQLPPDERQNIQWHENRIEHINEFGQYQHCVFPPRM